MSMKVNYSLNEICTQTLTRFFTGKTSNSFLIGVSTLMVLLSLFSRILLKEKEGKNGSY